MSETTPVDRLARVDAMLRSNWEYGGTRPTVAQLEMARNELAELAGEYGVVLNELEQLRDWHAALNEAQVSLQGSSFYCGWLKGFNAMPTAGVYTQAHLDTLEYAEELRAIDADSALQRPERDGES